MSELKATFVSQDRNIRTYQLRDTVEIDVEAGGLKENWSRDMDRHVITITFRDTVTGERPVIRIGGIDYVASWAYGSIDEIGDGQYRATGGTMNLHRSGPEAGRPPTGLAQSKFYTLIREIITDTIDNAADLDGFLTAGVQLKARRDIDLLMTKVVEAQREYNQKIGELYENISEVGDAAHLSADGRLVFPTFTGVGV